MSTEFILSPNMSLPVPIVGVAPGPNYATDVNNCLGILDQHNHASGNGVQITPAGLNINVDLSFNSNNAILLRSVRFNPNASTLSGVADLGCLYEAGVDLYYNDGVGNQVRITQNGSVAGATGSITGLVSPASASYNAGSSTFIWQSNVNTPANMDAGSYIFRNITANSDGLTLQAPASLSSNYSVTLPPNNGTSGTKFLSYDTGNNIGIAAQIQSTDIGTGAVEQSNLAPRTTGVTVPAGGVAVSVNSGTFSYGNSTAYGIVTNLTVTITTTGRPIFVGLTSEYGNDTQGVVQINTNGGSSGAASAIIAFANNGTILSSSNLLSSVQNISGATPTNELAVNPASFSFLDFSPAGTYTYTVLVKSVSTSPVTVVTVFNTQLVAYEL